MRAIGRGGAGHLPDQWFQLPRGLADRLSCFLRAGQTHQCGFRRGTTAALVLWFNEPGKPTL